MGKKYLDTKENSLESSILGVWKQAAEENEEINDAVSSVRMDGRTRTYREHRAKLEAARVRREAKKLDTVNPDAAKKKFDDRKDKDIDNDGDVDDSDKYLHKRRKAVTKAVAKEDVDEQWEKKLKKIRGNTPADEGRRGAIEDDIAREKEKKNPDKKLIESEIDAEKLHKDSYEMGTDEYREYLEKLTPGEGVDKEWAQARDFKVQSMKEALAQVWGLDEYITKEGARKKVNGGDGRRIEKEAHKPGHEEDDDEEEKNGKKGKKGKADTGTGKPAAIEVNPTIKASKGY